jgi:hypothetical protein
MALQILSTSSSQSQPSAGTFFALSPHLPRARLAILEPASGILDLFRFFRFFRTIRAPHPYHPLARPFHLSPLPLHLSPSAARPLPPSPCACYLPLPPLQGLSEGGRRVPGRCPGLSSSAPSAAPGRGRSRFPTPDPRSPNAWGFLQELFSRACMGFPPAPAVAETRLVRLRRRPEAQDPGAWSLLRPRPLTLSSSLPPRPPPAVTLHSSRSHAPRPKGVWPFFLGQTRPAFPSCSPDLTPFPLPTLGEGALSTRQTRLHHLGARSSRHDDRRSGTSTAERRLLTPRPALTTMSACKHVFPIGGSHARRDVNA